MSGWIRIAAVNDCTVGTSLELVAEGRMIALYQTEEGFFALDGVCSHQGGPLGKGTLCGAIVTCPWHGWQFDVRDGQHQLSESIVQESIPVRVQDGEVYVEL